MFRESLKVVGLLVIALLLSSGIFLLTGPRSRARGLPSQARTPNPNRRLPAPSSRGRHRRCPPRGPDRDPRSGRLRRRAAGRGPQSIGGAAYPASCLARPAERWRRPPELVHLTGPIPGPGSGRPSDSGGTRSVGRELFERVWVKDDPRSHGGDGLGPVFNGIVLCRLSSPRRIRRRRRASTGISRSRPRLDRPALRRHGFLLRVQHGFRLGSDGLPDGKWFRALAAFRGHASTREPWPQSIPASGRRRAWSCTPTGPTRTTTPGARPCPVGTGRS